MSKQLVSRRRRPGRKRRYTTDEAREMARRIRFEGETLREISKNYNMHPDVVRKVAERAIREYQGTVRHQLATYTRAGHQQKLEELVCRALMAIDPEFEPKSAFQLSYAHKNLFSDLQLLQGLPTEIHAHLIDHRDRLREAREKIISSLPTEVQKALGQGKGPQDMVDVAFPVSDGDGDGE